MKTSRALTAVLTIGAFTVASLFAAAPASAATLPSGQKITVVDSVYWQFSEASPVDAALTPTGEGPGLIPIDTYVEAVDVNDDGLGYGFTTAYEQLVDEECEEEFCPPIIEPIGATLWEADATTGQLSAPIPVEVNIEDAWFDADECLAIDYSGGTILAACNIYGDGNIAAIGEMDPDTGRLYPDTILFGEDFLRFQAIALDPIDGDLWGFAIDEDVFGLYTAWVIAGDETSSPFTTEMAIYGADFDRDGVLWVSSYRPEEPPARLIEPGEDGLAILNLETGDFTFEAAYSDQEQIINALTVWGKPVLAATGSTAPVAPVVGAAIALLLGTILAGVTVLRTRRERTAE